MGGGGEKPHSGQPKQLAYAAHLEAHGVVFGEHHELHDGGGIGGDGGGSGGYGGDGGFGGFNGGCGAGGGTRGANCAHSGQPKQCTYSAHLSAHSLGFGVHQERHTKGGSSGGTGAGGGGIGSGGGSGGSGGGIDVAGPCESPVTIISPPVPRVYTERRLTS